MRAHGHLGLHPQRTRDGSRGFLRLSPWLLVGLVGDRQGGWRWGLCGQQGNLGEPASPRNHAHQIGLNRAGTASRGQRGSPWSMGLCADLPAWQRPAPPQGKRPPPGSRPLMANRARHKAIHLQVSQFSTPGWCRTLPSRASVGRPGGLCPTRIPSSALPAKTPPFDSCDLNLNSGLFINPIPTLAALQDCRHAEAAGLGQRPVPAQAAVRLSRLGIVHHTPKSRAPRIRRWRRELGAEGAALPAAASQCGPTLRG